MLNQYAVHIPTLPVNLAVALRCVAVACTCCFCVHVLLLRARVAVACTCCCCVALRCCCVACVAVSRVSKRKVNALHPIPGGMLSSSVGMPSRRC